MNVKTFTDNQKLTELVARRPAIQEILKAEMKGHQTVRIHLKNKEHKKGNQIGKYKRQYNF